jgi:peptidoglycan-N-acetylglucosamine deacetylase
MFGRRARRLARGEYQKMRTQLTARLAIGCALLAGLAGLAGCGGSASRPGAAATAQPHPAPVATPTPGSASARPSGPPPAPAPAATQPAPPVRGRLAGTDWTYIPTSNHVVALTFDAGANDDAVASILATLQRAHVPATFFLTGNFVGQFRASAQRIASAGYRIGDHTITHPYLTQLSDSAVTREILGGAAQITAVTGVNPAPLLRFPYGDADARTIALANRAGYVPVRWTVDTLGWEGNKGHITTSVVISRVLGALRPGEIVLMHVGSNPDDHTMLDAGALPAMISDLKARGYSFVTLDALTG